MFEFQVNNSHIRIAELPHWVHLRFEVKGFTPFCFLTMKYEKTTLAELRKGPRDKTRRRKDM